MNEAEEMAWRQAQTLLVGQLIREDKDAVYEVRPTIHSCWDYRLATEWARLRCSYSQRRTRVELDRERPGRWLVCEAEIPKREPGIFYD